MRTCEPSPTVALDTQAKALQAQGINIINLTVGELDFATPLPLQEAVRTAVEQDTNHYSPVQGLLVVREAIVRYFAESYHVQYDPSQVLVTNGAKQALFSTFQVLIESGDEVIVPQPAWVSYTQQIKLAGGRMIAVPTTPDYQLDNSAIAAAITAHTKAIVINSPNNPTGAIYSKASLQALVALARQHKLWIISDEIYEQIRYDQAPYTSMAELYPEQSIIINGISKAGGVTGWRVGYALGPQAVIKNLTNFQSQLCGNVANPMQLAALAALPLDPIIWQSWLELLQQRRALVLNWIAQHHQLQCVTPAGAFYCFIDIRAYTADSEQFCQGALEQAGVALVPGKYFGQDGCIRLSFAHDQIELAQALKKLTAYLNSFTSSLASPAV